LLKEKMVKFLAAMLSVGVCCCVLASCCTGGADEVPQTESTSAEVEVAE